MDKKRKPPNYTAHHWSGWPGAFCLKCFREDPVEILLAEGAFGEDGTDDLTEEQKAQLAKDSICPIEGVLEWSEDGLAWVLYKPDGTKWCKGEQVG